MDVRSCHSFGVCGARFDDLQVARIQNFGSNKLARILQALGGTGLDSFAHGEACLRQLVSLSYFQDVATRATPLNGASVGELETSGIIFLRPLLGDPEVEMVSEERFVVELPRLFYFYFSQNIAAWNDPFPEILLRGAIELTEDNFPVFILNLHKATYIFFTWKRCWSGQNSCRATLRDIYADAAIALGEPSVLDQPVLVRSDVEYRECPVQTEAGAAYIVDDPTSVRVKSLSGTIAFNTIDMTSGRYFVQTRKRAPDADTLTPHGREQYNIVRTSRQAFRFGPQKTHGPGGLRYETTDRGREGQRNRYARRRVCVGVTKSARFPIW